MIRQTTQSAANYCSPKTGKTNNKITDFRHTHDFSSDSQTNSTTESSDSDTGMPIRQTNNQSKLQILSVRVLLDGYSLFIAVASLDVMELGGFRLDHKTTQDRINLVKEVKQTPNRINSKVETNWV